MHTLSGIELRDRFIQGHLKAEEIAAYFIKRIEKYDSSVGAFLHVNKERVLQKARALDQKKAAGANLGKLAAVPIAVKDNIHCKGERTTCGSRFLINYEAPFDATVTRLIEEEDALIIGKTNLDEFAMGSSTEYSALQQTRNPWNLDCVPGGSSGGSAAAVAARFCPIALGTDTGGSIRQPASFCGTAGFKPTYGRVSRFGLVAFGSSLDQIGPFAHSVADLSLIMEVIGKHCEKDSTSISADSEEYLRDLPDDLQGKKIGVPWGFLADLREESRSIFNSCLEKMRSVGAEIIETNLSLFQFSIPVYYILATAEASTNLARFDGIRYGVRSPRANTLNEVYDLSKEEGFGPEVKRRIILGTYVLSAGYQDAYYKKAQKVRTLMIREYKEVFQQCDLIAMPTTPTSAFHFGNRREPLQMYLEDTFTTSANLAGLPAASIPGGLFSDGNPMGLQLIGPAKRDVAVLQAAHAFEKVSEFNRRLPEIACKE